MKKFLGILLSVCMLLGLAVIPAAAADGFDWQISVSFDQEAGRLRLIILRRPALNGWKCSY